MVGMGIVLPGLLPGLCRSFVNLLSGKEYDSEYDFQ